MFNFEKIMKKLTFILVDDDEMYCDYSLQQLALIENITCAAVCNNPIEAWQKITELKPDFLILDVEMPNLTGIDLVKSLHYTPLVIFITSHSNFAVNAFELEAVDYIVKPAKTERMLKAIDKIINLIALKSQNQNSENFSIHLEDSFFIKDKSMFTKILFSEVMYFESLGDFTYIFLKNKPKKVILSSLKSIENQLPKNNFLRISRSHIINLKMVTAIDSETVFLEKINLVIGKTFNELASKIILGNQVIKRYV